MKHFTGRDVKISTKIAMGFTAVTLVLLANMILFFVSLQTYNEQGQVEKSMFSIVSDIRKVLYEKNLYAQTGDRTYSQKVMDDLERMHHNVDILRQLNGNDRKWDKYLSEIDGNIVTFKSHFEEHSVIEDQLRALEDNLYNKSEKLAEQAEKIQKQLDVNSPKDAETQYIQNKLGEILRLILQQRLYENAPSAGGTRLEGRSNLDMIIEDGNLIMNILKQRGAGVSGYRIVSLAREYKDTLRTYDGFKTQKMSSELEINSYAEKIEEMCSNTAENISLQVKENMVKLKIRLIAIFLFSILMSTLLVFIISIHITKRMKNLVSVTEKIAQGDYSTEVAASAFKDEIDVLSHSVNAMAKSLKASEAEMRNYNERLTEQVEERTRELTETLEHLKRTQFKLIQSEKLAALGQLISGIAHEINTPLGAINSSVGNIKNMYSNLMDEMPQEVRKLEDQEMEILKALLVITANTAPVATTKEERILKKKLEQDVAEKNLPDPYHVVDCLCDMGVYELEKVEHLIQSDNRNTVLELARKISSIWKSVDTADVSVKRAAKVVNALKSFSHFDNRGVMTMSNVIDGIETTLTLYHNKIKRGVDIVRNYRMIPLIECDMDKLNQVWTNLIGNALYAMDYFGRLEIETKVEKGYLVVSFTDSGKGIPKEIEDRIFEPFFTTKPTGEGNGLGLDISRKIIEMHNGDILFQSQPGKTTFFVRLPLVQN